MRSTPICFFLFWMFLLPGFAIAQRKVYLLKDSTASADISPGLMNMLYKKRGEAMNLLETAFKPVKGKFMVYRFISVFRGESFTGETKDFHDVLIVKTDAARHIIQAYQYTLEWAELPFESDLYQSSCRHTLLKDGMEISLFQFERPWYTHKEDSKLAETAIVQMGSSSR